MRKYGYLVVEGPHDVEFAYRLLTPFGMKRIKNESELDTFFAPLIPRQYPPKGDLQRRMPTPLFLQNETHTVAIHSAIGDSQLINVMVDNAGILNDLNAVIGIGILLDSDKEISAHQRYTDIKQTLATKSSQFKLHDEPGKIHSTNGMPNVGAFVLPDNTNDGTLEDLLIDCAGLVYPQLLTVAKDYVNAAKNAGINANELKEFNKPAGNNKAIIGAMANIFRPGKSVQVSIQDNSWLKGHALELSRIKSVQEFLNALFELKSLSKLYIL